MITGNPLPQLSIIPGKSAGFMVTATGDGLMYQWQKDGIDIIGATLSTYILSSVVESDAGEYQCVVSNRAGHVTSNAAYLTVCEYFTISIPSHADKVLIKKFDDCEYLHTPLAD